MDGITEQGVARVDGNAGHQNCTALSEISKSVEKMSDQLAEHDRSLEPRIDKAIEKAQSNEHETRKPKVVSE